MPESAGISPVYAALCGDYAPEALTSLFRAAFAEVGFTRELVEGKKVLLKPNLVLAKKPDHGATTHPAFIKACADAVNELHPASVTVADSPGGPFNAAALSLVYRTCELAPLASDSLRLNEDVSWVEVHPDGKKLKSFHMIRAAAEADVIIDLCKLKSHGLTTMSCAVKNLFGLIPGVEKFEMHSNFPEIGDFSEMLVDLAEYVTRKKTFLAVCDGILAMEGNGPSYGTPRKAGVVLVSRSPFALDVTAEHVMKFDGSVLHVTAAAERGLVPRDWRQIPLLGLAECPSFDFRRPDTNASPFLSNLANLGGGRFAKLFEARPEITKACVGCGKCAQSCPKHTVTVETVRGKKRAVIHREACIRCYCCQELCPIGAVGTHQNFLIRLIH